MKEKHRLVKFGYKLIVFLVLLIPTIVRGENLTENFSLSGDLLPSPFLYFNSDRDDNYIFLVEKRSQQFYVLHIKDSTLHIETTYTCSTGKISGDKNEIGDFKTPEGIYFIRAEKDPQSLALIYGAGAYVLDYPNSFDKIYKKNGYGIWIHGTDEPERIKNSNDTKGCIVLINEDFQELVNYVKLNITPVVIVNELVYRKKQYVDDDKKRIFSFLQFWENSWETKQLDDFLECYSKKFYSNNMNKSGYKNYKKRVFKQYNNIDVQISSIQVFSEQAHFVINFYQNYQTELYHDFGIKQLYIIIEDNKLRIIKEVWTKIQ